MAGSPKPTRKAPRPKRAPHWPDDGLTKGDLLRWYARASGVLLPHVRGRPLVLKRYPNGIEGDYNQNAWGRTLASVYSPRPRPGAPVSATEGDLWAGILDPVFAFDVETLLEPAERS